MPNEFWIAGAGSGKTQKVIEDAIEVLKAGGRVLVVTYTMNNQAELRSRFVELYGKHSDDFVVKGLFSFYLEDLVVATRISNPPESHLSRFSAQINCK